MFAAYFLQKFRVRRSANLRSSWLFLAAQAIPWLSIFFSEATLKRIIVKFLSDDSGATAIEYGLIAAGISLAIIAVVNGLGSNLNGMFSSINSSLK